MQFCNTIVIVAQPKVRPLERFWPYAELPENLSVEERAVLDSDLQHALIEARPDRPFSITVVFSRLDAPDFPRALDLARQSPDFRETGIGSQRRYRARFLVADAARLHDVFNVVGRAPDTEILVDDQPVPYGREFWIPLISFFINAYW